MKPHVDMGLAQLTYYKVRDLTWKMISSLQEGHLRSGDHILQIGDVNVRGMSSEQVALVLRQSGSHVRLIVARSIYEPPPYQVQYY